MPRKTFKRNVQPIIIDIEDIYGEMHTLESRVVFTPEVADKISQLTFDESITSGEKVIRQMEMLFGKKEHGYKNFEMSLMGGVMEYVAEILATSNESKKKENGLTI